MSLIYIRHAQKAYRNGCSQQYAQDPNITQAGFDACTLKAQELVKIYGMPTAIYCSPYLRCRQTAIALNMALQEPVPMYVDITLSEYLGNQTKQDIRPCTAEYKPPFPEAWREFILRTRNHNPPEGSCVWIVTHGLVLSMIGKEHYNMQGKKKNWPLLGGYITNGKALLGFLDSG